MNELATYLSKYRDSENPIFNISLSGIAQMPLDKQRGNYSSHFNTRRIRQSIVSFIVV